jgi:hypothetical protein
MKYTILHVKLRQKESPFTDTEKVRRLNLELEIIWTFPTDYAKLSYQSGKKMEFDARGLGRELYKEEEVFQSPKKVTYRRSPFVFIVKEFWNCRLIPTLFGTN